MIRLVLIGLVVIGIVYVLIKLFRGLLTDWGWVFKKNKRRNTPPPPPRVVDRSIPRFRTRTEMEGTKKTSLNFNFLKKKKNG